MISRIVVIFLIPAAFCGQNVSAQTLRVDSTSASVGYDFGGKLLPTWSGGGLLAVEAVSTSSPVVRVFGRDGHQMAVFAVTIPKARTIMVWSVSRGSSGVVALSGSAIDAEGRRSFFVALFPPGGALEKVILTGAYFPRLITVALDGTVWTQGYSVGKDVVDPNIFWHFDESGKKIGSMVPQSTFAVLHDLESPDNRIGASANRVAWLCPKERRYIELSSDGKITTDTEVTIPKDEQTEDFVLMDDGHAFVRTVAGPPLRISLYSLDTKTGLLRSAFLPASVPARSVRLLAGEGKFLIGLGPGGSILTLTVEQ